MISCTKMVCFWKFWSLFGYRNFCSWYKFLCSVSVWQWPTVYFLS